jgi:hypothetical protein
MTKVMNIVLKKPILVAGVSLSFLLWIGQNITHHLGEISNLTFFVVVFFGGCSFILSKTKKNTLVTSSFKNINITDFEQKTLEIDRLIDTLVEEAKSSDKIEYSQQNYHLFKQNLSKVSEIIQRQNLQVGILNQGNYHHKLLPVFEKEFTNTELNEVKYRVDNLKYLIKQNEQILLQNDLILFVIKGDLTDSEKALIQQIKDNKQRILILFDDVEFGLEEDKNLIWQNIKNSLEGIIPTAEIIKISSQAQKVKVIKYQDNLNYQESEEITPTQYGQLVDSYSQILEAETEKLILLTAYRNALHLEAKIKGILNQIRKAKSLVVMEKYQVMAATATFANPVASLDLLAAAAINTQMIVDLSKIYQQQLSLNQAREVSIALGKLMMKLGIVEISSQAVGNLLKSNALTFVAGGIIQGVSAAYLTRVCGLSLVEYYQEAELNNAQSINLNLLKEKIKFIFQQTKENNLFSQFVQTTALRLKNS